MIIAVDFDGTIVENRYPAIGRENPFAVRTLKMLQEEGHFLILWSCREGEELDAALDWCRERGLEFYAANKDFPEENEQENLSFSRKIKADMFIDDRNVGGLPDWGAIYQMIHENKAYEEIIGERGDSERNEYAYDNLPKEKWWQF